MTVRISRSRIHSVFAMAAAVLAVAVVLISGNAYGLSSSVTASDNTVAADYISVDLYERAGDGTAQSTVFDDTFTMVTTDCFAGKADVQTSSGWGATEYRITSATSVLSADDVYLAAISNQARLSLEATMQLTGTSNVSDVVYTITVGGQTVYSSKDGISGISIEPNTAHKVVLTADYTSCSYYAGGQTAEPVFPTVVIRFIASSQSGDMDSTVQTANIKPVFTSAEAAKAVADINNATVKEGDTHPSYTEDNGETYYIVPDNDRTDGNAGVFISGSDDSNDISDAPFLSLTRNTFETTVEVPAEHNFVLELHIGGNWIISHAEITVTLTINGGVYQGTFGQNGTWYLSADESSGSLLKSYTLEPNMWMGSHSEITVKLEGSTNALLSQAEIQAEIVIQSPENDLTEQPDQQ